MRLWLLGTLIVAVVAVPAFGATILAPNLGSAASFGLLAGTISNTGTSVVIGDVGAITTITGFTGGGPGTATGTMFPAPNGPSSTVGLAYTAFVNAFDHAFDDTGTGTPVTQTLSGLTTSQTFQGNNVYKFTSTDVTSTAAIILTFHAQTSSSDVFIIKIANDLQINAPITFLLENGALASNIYWIVGRDAVISGSTAVVPTTWDGNFLVGRNFTMSAGTGGSGPLAGTINGCVYAETAATLAGTTDIGPCSAASAEVPEPGTLTLFGLGAGFLLLGKFRSIC